MILADSAQVADNKLFILGGGWSFIGPDPTPSAVALYIKVPWDQANMKHRLLLELVDSDGGPVEVQSPVGDQQIRVESEFEVGRPPGMHQGTPIDISLALNFGPIPLSPDGRYEWRLTIDDRSDETWRLAFSTRPATPAAPPALGT
jgi:hypothetical protein